MRAMRSGPAGPFGRGGPGAHFGRPGHDAAHDAGHDEHGHPHGHQGPHGHHGPHGDHGPHRGPGARGGQAAVRLLALLAKHGPSTVGEIAEHIGVDQPRASRLVRAAVDAGHVRRETDARDARRSILVITDAGRSALSALLGRRRAAIERALADFTDAERAQFASLFTRFAEGLRRPRDAREDSTED